MDIKCENGDLAVVDGDFVLVDGLEEIRQDVATRLRLIAGEVRLDQRAGIDPVIFEPGLTDGERAQLVAETIRAAPGIVYIAPPELTLDTSARALNVRYDAEASLKDLAVRFGDSVAVE